jgi:hypothetical protein
MSYVCPVCETPQADAEHLANHLAFTAMLRGGGHGEWLDERVPEWAAADPESLAPEVAEYVEETETELDAEDGHDHDGGFEERLARGGGYGRDAGMGGDALADGAEAREILEEAEAMTREMRAGSGDAEDGDAENAGGEDS